MRMLKSDDTVNLTSDWMKKKHRKKRENYANKISWVHVGHSDNFCKGRRMCEFSWSFGHFQATKDHGLFGASDISENLQTVAGNLIEWTVRPCYFNDIHIRREKPCLSLKLVETILRTSMYLRCNAKRVSGFVTVSIAISSSGLKQAPSTSMEFDAKEKDIKCS